MSNLLFSVPGWNVSAPLKTEIAEPKTKGKKNKKQAKGKDHADAGLKPAQAPKDLTPKKQESAEGSKKRKQRGEHVNGDEPQKRARTQPEKNEGAHVSSREPKASSKSKKSGQNKSNEPSQAVPSTKSDPAASIPPTTKLTPLQSKMRAKLTSARFRHLNESLYTTPSTESFTLFGNSPEMFTEYHAGFAQQVGSWPENPVDGYIRDLLARGAVTDAHQPDNLDPATGRPVLPPLPRDRRTQRCRIADLGAGTAPLARALHPHRARLRLDVDSFDLVADPPHVTRADLADLPLRDGAVDVAICCLALMGTNWLDFVDEAYRALRWKGELWVAEVKSRFARPRTATGGIGARRPSKPAAPGRKGAQGPAAEEVELPQGSFIVDEVDGDGAAETTDVRPFVEALARRGFVLRQDRGTDLSNKMFVKLWFVKAAAPTAGKNVREGERSQAPEEPAPNRGFGNGQRRPKGKFIDKAAVVDEEAKLLKPCVYKLR